MLKTIHVTWRRYGRRVGLALRSRTLLLKEVQEGLIGRRLRVEEGD